MSAPLDRGVGNVIPGLVAPVRVLLLRYGVPHEALDGVRVVFDSEESVATLPGSA